MKKLMTGNEAVARGAYEAGVGFASAYPGTPSTEILENIGQHYSDKIICEWSANEKVALEAAIGASVMGARSLAAMKHVGVNVAADPMFTFSYTGVTGGMLLVSADDPGQHSSQNEQDNRYYAKSAKMLMLEPSDSQEAKDMVRTAVEISERFDSPVLFRMTTRVCHSKSVVKLGEVSENPYIPYEKNYPKYGLLFPEALEMHPRVEERLRLAEEFSNHTELNYIIDNHSRVGVVAAGVAFQYAREVFGDSASYLKIGFSYPLPMDKIWSFAQTVDTLYVIEELEPFMEEQMRAAGISCIGKELIPRIGELNPDILRKSIFGTDPETLDADLSLVTQRPATFCAGCPHRGFFYQLAKKKNVIISSDIGCYGLSGVAPYHAKDFAFCMGSGFASAHGASRVAQRYAPDKKIVGVLGDSTFFHSGMTGLVNAVYNKSDALYCILDNRITGMTGHQENPGSGKTLSGEGANISDIYEIVKAMGVKNIRMVNPTDLKAMNDTLDWGIALKELAVIITRWPCALKKKTQLDVEEFGDKKYKMHVSPNACIGCKACMRAGCPALIYDVSTKKVSIDASQCDGCNICAQICPKQAISREEIGNGK